MVSKTDFDIWKADPVTKAYFSTIQFRIDEAKELAHRADQRQWNLICRD